MGIDVNVTGNYLPKGNYLLAVLSIVIMVLAAIVFVTALKRCYGLLRTKKRVVDSHGDLVLDLVED